MAESDSQAPQLQFSCPKCMHVFSLSDADPIATRMALVAGDIDIVKTNDPPLESQIPVLRDFISKGRARIAALETRVALLDSLMNELVQEENKLAAEVSMHENSLSLLRRMPTEILSHIFAFTLPPHETAAKPAPWTVSAVCARWRAIVISQPRFWTFIHYVAYVDGEAALGDDAILTSDRLKLRIQLRKLEIQLRRSAQLPLNVEFHMNPYYRWSMEEYEPMLQAICKEAHRWETAAFSGPEDLSTVLQSSIRDQLAHLRKLTIEISYSDRNDPVEIFKDAPVLHTISFNRDLWMRHVQPALGAVASIWRVQRIDDIGPPSSIVQDPVALPNLRRLSISNPHFLKYLRTPALEELYCDYDVPPVLSFLRQENCKLQKLVLWEIEDIIPDPADLTRILEIPTVTRLALFFPLPTELVCDFYSQSSTMAPALEYLSCFLKVDSEVGDEIQDEFMKAIESQWTRGPFKSVKVYGENLQIVSDRLDVLRTEGMECMVFGDESFPCLENLDDIPPELQILSVQ